jgi:nucleoside-diphosphate-sugar epimerase
MAKLIFGCGYLGRRVAQMWCAAGEQVFAVTRSAERAQSFIIAGINPIVADVTRPESLADLPACDTVLYAIGHDRAAAATIHEVYAGGLRAVLDRLPEQTAKLIYISSTGVYGQSHGETVDEHSATEPTREGGRACLAAERTLAEHRLGARGIVLRMAGLYGPGRIPLADDICAGRPIAAPRTGLLNLIHVDDAARVVLAADRRAIPPCTYVVSDGCPVERQKYYQELARLLAAPEPRFAAPPPDSPAAGRAVADKRVDNTRMLGELGVRLEFPSYREGLAAIVADKNQAPNIA